MANLTPRQEKWFASVKASLERDTGKPLDEWVQIVMRDCPETDRRKREAWLKDTYGMSMIRAGQIVNAAWPEVDPWEDPEQARALLWTDPASTAILTAFEAAIADIPGVLMTQRKSYTAWSRQVQFAALKPLRGGTVRLGVAVPPATDPRLSTPKNESWSERLKSVVPLASPPDIDDSLVALVRLAWDKA
ncbi:MAG: DUF4287 domain-containing protein [Asticcacaulis sp.]|nr:DUF4287 domain-containing protein [Asticcacaulis sp.]